MFGTIDAWLVFKLTGELRTDVTNASRTMLYDIRRGDWDDELLELFGDVPEAALPEVRPSIGEFGTLRDGALGAGHDGVPVSGIAGDQQAALYGQGCLEPGLGKNTYGTGSFVLLNTGDEVPTAPAGLLATVAWGIGERTIYALEAAIFVTGAGVQWLRDGLGIIEAAAETEELARVAGLQRRRLLRPRADRPRLAALGPLRARHDRRPHARQHARAPRARDARGDRLSDRRRGAGDGGASGRELRASCAPTAARPPTRWLMQFQADVLGVPVVVAEVAETTALGAALLAGVGGRRLDAGRRRPARRRARPLRAADGRGRARRADRRLAARRRACPRMGARVRCRHGEDEAQRAARGDGQRRQGPASGGALRPLPRALAHEGARLRLRGRARPHAACGR